jgi:hypothetical protein
MKESKETNRYKLIDGKRLIEVRVKSPRQLFDSRDPAPFHERDLDDDFVEYISAAAREFSKSRELKIVIHVEENETKELTRDLIRESIKIYFAYRINLQRVDLKSFMKRAQLYLMIGVVVLVICLSVAQRLAVPTAPQGAIGILREGIIIFGWISIWKPIELVLFDWYPLYEKLRFYKRLLKTEIDVQFNAPATL